MKKKIFNFIVSFAVFIGVGIRYNGAQVLTSLYAESNQSFSLNGDVKEWNGEYDLSWYDGEDTEFNLSTAEKFAGFVKLVNDGHSTKNMFFRLVGNFDFSQRDFPSVESFHGTLEGNNYCISGLSNPLINNNYGLINQCNLSAELNDNDTVGIVCRNNYGGITNCEISGKISATSINVGGICGYQKEGIIENCICNATIDMKNSIGGNVGGICGKSEDSQIRNCIFKSEQLTAYSETTKKYSIVYDTVYEHSSQCNVKLVSAGTALSGAKYNDYHDFYYVESEVNSNLYVGGICGMAIQTSIENSENITSINGTNNYLEDKDEVEQGSGYMDNNRNVYTIIYIHNSNLDKTALSNCTSYVGGICGFSNSDILYCRNSGSISSSGRSEYFSGGICGWQSKSGILSCCNYGDIFGKNNSETAGGICGYAEENTIESVNNLGIAGGGICFKAYLCSINNVYNVGNSSRAIVNQGKVGSYSVCYYLNTSATTGLPDSNDKTVAKSAANMKKEDFASNLGASFVYIEDNYPKLVWEIEETDLIGDINEDSIINIADEVMLCKCLLGNGTLTKWENADLCKDDKINVFDLVLLRRLLIENSN